MLHVQVQISHHRGEHLQFQSMKQKFTTQFYQPRYNSILLSSQHVPGAASSHFGANTTAANNSQQQMATYSKAVSQCGWVGETMVGEAVGLGVLREGPGGLDPVTRVHIRSYPLKNAPFPFPSLDMHHRNRRHMFKVYMKISKKCFTYLLSVFRCVSPTTTI